MTNEHKRYYGKKDAEQSWNLQITQLCAVAFTLFPALRTIRVKFLRMRDKYKLLPNRRLVSKPLAGIETRHSLKFVFHVYLKILFMYITFDNSQPKNINKIHL